MNYDAFTRKVLKDVRSKLFDNRTHSTDVLYPKQKFKKRFSAELGSITWDSKAPKELLSISDSAYQTSDSKINLYEIYLRIKKKEITKQEAFDEILVRAEGVIQLLLDMGDHYYDTFNKQVAFDKENGIKADYSDWFDY